MFNTQYDGQQYHVRFHHYVDRNLSLCIITSGDGQAVTTQADGVAVCGENDQFCRAVGRKVALKRALSNLFPQDKAAREFFWSQYRSISGDTQ